MKFDDSKPADGGSRRVSPECDALASAGYWPAEAMKLVAGKKYSAAVQLCKERLRLGDESTAGRTAYALALYRAGQIEAAEDLFHQLLARDPHHLVALKFLGDIAFSRGDEWAAMSNYERVLEIDPETSGLSSDLPQRGSSETARTITLRHPAEEPSLVSPPRTHTREHAPHQPFLYSETMGDLYLAQGHARLAAEVYQQIYDVNPSPRLAEKLAQAQEKQRERDLPHVHQTD
ncbi:MAG: tetratricopeptide repeat protein [candidate division Zixibacteria bacterium]|nr:tetratricopeptide repeat protein [candidate division Zixibacteria bacterium]